MYFFRFSHFSSVNCCKGTRKCPKDILVSWFIFGSFLLLAVANTEIIRNFAPMIEQVIVKELLQAVEQKTGLDMQSPTDFEQLRQRLPYRDGLSVSTLKRLWQYVPSGHEPRRATLDILARFCGYADWQAFRLSRQTDSGFLGDAIRTEQLSEGSMVCVTWNPNRRMVLRRLVNERLEVVEAEHAKLQPGDTFYTAWLAVGQPLCASSLQRNGQPLEDYVAGRRDGLTSVTVFATSQCASDKPPRQG